MARQRLLWHSSCPPLSGTCRGWSSSPGRRCRRGRWTTSKSWAHAERNTARREGKGSESSRRPAHQTISDRMKAAGETSKLPDSRTQRILHSTWNSQIIMFVFIDIILRLPWWKVWSTRLSQWVMPIQEWAQRRRGWTWRASLPQCTKCTATIRGSNLKSDWVGMWSLGDSRTLIFLVIQKLSFYTTINSDLLQKFFCVYAVYVMIIRRKSIKLSSYQWGGGCAPLRSRKASGSTNKFITGGIFLRGKFCPTWRMPI